MNINFSGKNDPCIKNLIFKFHQQALEKINNHEFALHMNQIIEVCICEKMRSSAGKAINGKTIKINYRLLSENEKELENTYFHELAHIICQRHYSKRVNHRQEWKDVMNLFGKKPERCHDLDTSKLERTYTIKKHLYVCNCSERFLSARRHNSNEKYLKFNGSNCFICLYCHSKLRYTGKTSIDY